MEKASDVAAVMGRESPKLATNSLWLDQHGGHDQGPAWVAMATGTDMPRSGFLDIAEPTAPSSDNDTGRRHRVGVAMNIPAPAYGNYQQ
jgi:hypothetical protein